jgi:hypothetical protein
VRNDDVTAAAYVGSGDGATKPEQYTFQDPANTASVMPIQPGDTAVLRSSQTGLYCRLLRIGSGPELGMVCDQPTSTTATQFTYTGTGLAVGGVPMVSAGPGAPLLLANTTTTPITTTTSSLGFPPVGPDLVPGVPFTVQTTSPTAGYVRTDSATSPASTGTGDGTTPPEQFTAVNPTSTSSAIEPGDTAILKSEATGMYCRLAPLPNTSPEQIGVLCDQPTPATATPLTYTGSGLSTAEGVPLVSSGPGGPLVLANTTTTAPEPDSNTLTFAPTGVRAVCVVLGICQAELGNSQRRSSSSSSAG